MVRLFAAVSVAALYALVASGMVAQEKTPKLEQSWGQPEDPDGECKISVKGGNVTFSLPGATHDLWPGQGRKVNAPRVLQEVEGDFSVQVKVATSVKPENGFFRSGTLLIWQDDTTFIRLDSACAHRGGDIFDFYCYLHVFKDANRTVNETLRPLKDQPTELRLERNKSNIVASFSQDGGKTWKSFATKTVDFLPNKLKVGVAAINGTAAPYTVSLEDFKISTVLASAQTPNPRVAAAQPAPPAAPQARVMPPDAKAYSDAMRLSDPEKKIEALEKFLVDYPSSGGTQTVQRELLRTLIKTYPDQKEKILAQVDKLTASAPDTAKSGLFNTVAWELLGAGVLLDEAESFASQSIALMDEQKFVDGQKRIAELRKLPPPSDDELKKRFRTLRAGPLDTLGQIYLKQGKTAEAEKLLKEAYEANPASSSTAVALADLAQLKGDDASALDYLATAVLGGRSPAGTQEKLEALYLKTNKDATAGQSLEAMLDARYRKLFPTLHVAPYQPAAARSDRTVLAEVFTGSGCPPCVAADLAFDAMLERYSRKDLVVIMYHLHIPLPDPMTNPSTEARSKFYEVRSVPSYLLDGESNRGGGSRDATQGFYDRINPTIEQRLETAAEARLTFSASLEGTTVKVKADVSQIKDDATDVKLQVALVEEMLSFSGENGIRLHPMVVRSLAGPDAGGFAVDPAKPEAVEHTFDIAAVTEELKAFLDDFDSKLPAGRKLSQKKHEINPNNLSVVAFVQDQSTKKILQAAYVSLKAGGVAANQ